MNLTNSQWADLIIVGLMAVSVIVGCIKGFFRSIIGFVVAGLSILAGYLISPAFVQPVTDWLYPHAKDFLYRVAEKNITLPEDVSLTEEQLEEILRPMLEPLSKVVLWVIIGIVCAVIFSIVGNAVARKLDGNDTLRRADKRLGALLGLVESFVIFIIVFLVLAKIGMAENIYNSFDSSVMIKFYSTFIPADVQSLTINIPLLGQFDLKELFSGIEIRLK